MERAHHLGRCRQRLVRSGGVASEAPPAPTRDMPRCVAATMFVVSSTTAGPHVDLPRWSFPVDQRSYVHQDGDHRGRFAGTASVFSHVSIGSQYPHVSEVIAGVVDKVAAC